MAGEIEISINGNLLMYKKGYNPDFIQRTIEEKKLNGLMIFDHLDPLPNADFLYECSFLKGLSLAMLHDHGFEFLRALPNLIYLSINTWGKTVIDLSHQMALEKLSITWRAKKVKGLEQCKNIKDLGLIEYKEQDLQPIACLSRIEDLRIKMASIKSLNGIENLIELRSILLGNCRSLVSINELLALQKLQKVDIESCSKIRDFKLLKSIATLEKIRIWPKPV